MSDRSDQDAGKKQGGGGSTRDCPSCDGDCTDGPGCLAGFLFITLSGAASFMS